MRSECRSGHELHSEKQASELPLLKSKRKALETRFYIVNCGDENCICKLSNNAVRGVECP